MLVGTAFALAAHMLGKRTTLSSLLLLLACGTLGGCAADRGDSVVNGAGEPGDVSSALGPPPPIASAAGEWVRDPASPSSPWVFMRGSRHYDGVGPGGQLLYSYRTHCTVGDGASATATCQLDVRDGVLSLEYTRQRFGPDLRVRCTITSADGRPIPDAQRIQLACDNDSARSGSYQVASFDWLVTLRHPAFFASDGNSYLELRPASKSDGHCSTSPCARLATTDIQGRRHEQWFPITTSSVSASRSNASVRYGGTMDVPSGSSRVTFPFVTEAKGYSESPTGWTTLDFGNANGPLFPPASTLKQLFP